METIQICESERIREVDGIFQIERRLERDNTPEWHAYEFHGTITEAIYAAAYREIHTLPNDDYKQWKKASGDVIAKYQQILSGALEPRPPLVAVP